MQNSQVVHHHVGVGEVDDRLRPGLDQRADVVAGVDLRDQLDVGGPLDRRADLRADLAARTQDTDLTAARSRVQPSVERVR